MSSNPRFIMIGGFLGAGKTTTIARLAADFQQAGKRVVIVTNDQATDLVDTLLLRSQGFDVGEVAGSCFCCNFDALTDAVESLSAQERPDVVLAEPVGSCTDLVATVIRPLEQIYAQPFDIAPYGVIIKPSHGFKILGGGQGGFSPKAEYIFRKQIEEADFIILNRIDELSAAQVDELAALLSDAFPGTPLIRMSAKAGTGFDPLHDQLQQSGNFGQKLMEVDYDVYAEGEAELGWLNCQVKLEAEQPFDLDQCLIALLRDAQRELIAIPAEVAHLKVIGMADGAYGVANLVSNQSQATLSLASNYRGTSANLVINARVGMPPETLTELIEHSLIRIGNDIGLSHEVLAMQSFRPGRPVPTHRIA